MSVDDSRLPVPPVHPATLPVPPVCPQGGTVYRVDHFQYMPNGGATTYVDPQEEE